MKGSMDNRIIKCIVLVVALMLAVSNCAFGEQYSESDRYSLVYEIKADGTIEITGFIGSQMISNLGEVVIPETIDGRTVTSIADRAMAEDRGYPSVVIPDTVVEIGINPFCRSLQTITISPDNPNFALLDGVLFSKKDRRLICYPGDKLGNSYSIPEGIQSIGAYAFYGAKNLKEIAIAESVQEIGDFAFGYCEEITSITIPQNVSSIGWNPFISCKSLKDITAYNNARYEVVDRVLFDKASNALVSFPYGISDPYSYNRMKSYTIPYGTNSIEPYAFAGGLALNEVVIPDTVDCIKEYAFYQCRSLKSIYIPDGVTSIGASAFRECYEVSELTFGSGLISIGDYAFSGFELTKEIVLPEGLKEIGEGAFANNVPIQIYVGPQKITVPSSVDSIGEKAFYGWDRLTIIVDRDSNAAEYCRDNGLTYTYPDAYDWLTGKSEGNEPSDDENTVVPAEISVSPEAIEVPVYDEVTETAVVYETEVKETGDDAVEVPVSQAQMDAMNGIVPCFGITREQLNGEFNQVFDESGSWIANNYVPYQNLKDFPLAPSVDTLSLGIMSYFEKELNKTADYTFEYNLETGEFSENNNLFDNCIKYYIHNSAKYRNSNLISCSVEIVIDGRKIGFGSAVSTSGSFNNVTVSSYDIDVNLREGLILTIEYDYSGYSFPECPYIDLFLTDFGY